MIGLDTNILVRHLTQDDKAQSAAVARVIGKYAAYPKSLFISNIVLCELVWVLDRGYKYGKIEIIEAIRILLSTVEFAFEQHEVLWLALSDYQQYRADFSDILLGKINRVYGCKYTVTFDTEAKVLEEFRHIDDL